MINPESHRRELDAMVREAEEDNLYASTDGPAPDTRTEPLLVTVPSAGGWSGRPPLSQNVRVNRYERARIVRRLREHTAGALRAQNVPRGAVFVVATLWFVPKDGRSRPDPNNLLASLKPVVDALQPEKVTRLSTGRVRIDVGYGLIPNDSAEYARQTDVRIDPPDRERGPCWGVDLEITYPAADTASDTERTVHPAQAEDGLDEALAQRFALTFDTRPH